MASNLPNKVEPCLTHFAETVKSKLEVSAQRKKVDDICQSTRKILQETIYQDASESNVKAFEKQFLLLLEREKAAFKATPWIWHDVVRPAFMALLGIIVSIFTLPVRHHSKNWANYANSFFYKPDSLAFKMLKNEAEILIRYTDYWVSNTPKDHIACSNTKQCY